MPVPFGFSAGDIVIAIQLLSKVYKGLKETGGAASEYHELSQFVQGLILTLQHLQKIELVCSDPSLVKAVQTLSAAALKPVFEFIEEIQKYSWALNSLSSPGRLKIAYRKTEWILRVSKKAEKLRALIAAEMQPIHLLLESQSLKCFDLTSKQLSTLQEVLDSQATEQLAFNAAMLKAIVDLQSAITSSRSSANESRDVEELVDPLLDVNKESENRSKASSTSSSTLADISQFQLDAWNRLSEQLAAILLQLLVKAQQLTKYLLLMSPQLLLFLRTFFAAIPKGARLLIQDDIRFEDVLGRTHTLPYQYFSAWTVFEAYLKNEFKDRTGERYVNAGSYHVLNAVQGWVISKNRYDWSRSIFPGTQVAMSVILSSDKIQSLTSCPRCRKSLEEPAPNDSKQTCSACQWERYLKDEESDDTAPVTNTDLSDNELARDSMAGPWSAWIWSSEFQRHWAWRYDENGQIEYLWAGHGLTSRPRRGQNVGETETSDDKEITLFKRIHSSLPIESDEESKRESKEESDKESEEDHELEKASEDKPEEEHQYSYSTQQPSVDASRPQRHIRIGYDGRDDELLDLRYKRVSARSQNIFYHRGRVFMILWTGRVNPGSSRGSTHFPMVNYSETAYSEIRRFAVVRNKGAFSQCVPIQTYRRQGTLKAGIAVEDHAIIYTGPEGSEPPDLLPGEGITKLALRVEPAGSGVELDPISRINFGKTYTVEHNVKALNIGMVAEEHLDLLDHYWRAAQDLL